MGKKKRKKKHITDGKKNIYTIDISEEKDTYLKKLKLKNKNYYALSNLYIFDF